MADYRILIVDDEIRILQLLDDILSAQGYHVFQARTGKDALEKIPALLPNLVIMDIMMPDMDGAEVVRQLQEDATVKHIPVIFLSGIAAQVEGEAQGGINIAGTYSKALTKPFDQEELLRAVKQALQ